MKRAFLSTLLAVVLLGNASASVVASERDIHAAAQAGDLVRLRALLAGDPELIAARTSSGRTPLHAAALSCHADVIAYLLARGADLGAKDAAGNTPLHVAAAEGQRAPTAHKSRRAAVKLLLAAGADVNAANEEGLTTLHLALARQRDELLDLLLENGADLKAKDKSGRTPLHYAALGNMTKALTVLLSKQAEVDAADKLGNTPLHLAALRFRREATAELLKGGASVDSANHRGETALHLLASQSSNEKEVEPLLVAVAEVLLEHGAAVNQRAADGTTPLARALERKHDALAQLLRRSGGVK